MKKRLGEDQNWAMEPVTLGMGKRSLASSTSPTSGMVMRLGRTKWLWITSWMTLSEKPLPWGDGSRGAEGGRGGGGKQNGTMNYLGAGTPGS